MSLQTILDQLPGDVTESDLDTDKIDGSTPLNGVGVPEEKGYYASAFYKVLGLVEEGSVYYRDYYDDADNPDIVTLNTEYEDDYDPTLAIGPKSDSEPTGKTIYLIGEESEPIDLIAAVVDVASPIETATADVDGDGNDEEQRYLQLPVSPDTGGPESDPSNFSLPFGAIVADETTSDAYVETSDGS